MPQIVLRRRHVLNPGGFSGRISAHLPIVFAHHGLSVTGIPERETIPGEDAAAISRAAASPHPPAVFWMHTAGLCRPY
jgi:hypothetical protein